MGRKPITKIIVEINNLLKKEEECSIRYVANKTHSQWRTAEKALVVLKELRLVKEKAGTTTERKERIFFRMQTC